MPNNQLPGMLEDFVAYLIPPGDTLHPKAEAILQELEQAGLNRYSLIHHPKALIHTAGRHGRKRLQCRWDKQ